MLWNILFIASFSSSSGLKILSVLPFPQKSHHIVFNALIEELVHRGYEVTVYSGHPLNTNASNYKHIYIRTSIDDTLAGYTFEKMKKNIDTEPWITRATIQWYGMNMSDETLSLPEIKHLLQSNETFDVILLETLFAQEALLGFSYRFNVPVVTLTSLGPNSLLDSVMGNPNPLSYLPSFQLPYGSDLTLFQKLRTLTMYLSEQYYNYYQHIPHQEAVMVKHFRGTKDSPLPPLIDMMTNMAVVLLNTQPEVTHVRAFVPNMINVGGLHIPSKRKTLPQSIKEFLDESNEGVIYFSLGTTFQGSSMPLDIQNSFIKAFQNIPERVLWKIDEPPSNISSNVMTFQWVPQTDILGHQNCKAFITHGGLLSLLEATHFGVPLIGVPLFADQGWNVAKVEQAQIGIKLKISSISPDSVSTAIREILHNPKYRSNMHQLSAQMRNRLRESPLDTAVHWVEYVAKHQGAPQLRSPARNMSLIQYLLIDVLMFLTATLVISIYLIIVTLKFTCSRLVGSGQKIKSKKH